MNIQKGDYLVVNFDNREHLMKALENASGKTVEAVNEKMCYLSEQRTTATVGIKDVILNLGATPHPGFVYGLDTSTLFYTRKTHNDIGTVNFFYKPEKEVVKNLWAAFTKVHSILKKRGLDFLTNDICWEVIPYNGEKYAGMFLKSGKKTIPKRIQIRPESMPATEYVYILLHELGHNLHLSYVNSVKLNAYWLRMYNTSIKPVTITKDTSKNLLENLLAQEDSPSDFKGQLSEDDALAFKWIVRTISQVHGISLKDLDTFFEADMKEDITAVWPLHTIKHKDLAPILTDYATKNVKELIAEAFAFLLTGKKLPSNMLKLLEKTISHAKSNQ